MFNALIAFGLLVGAQSTESAPVIIEIPEPAAILFPSPEDGESIAVGRSAVYRVSHEGADPILRGSFQLNPKPLQSANGAILALLDVKDNGKSEVVILSLRSGAETRFERRVKTRHWTWFQPDQSILLINDEGLMDEFELLEFNLKTMRMDVRLTASDQVCDLLTASPGGEFFMEVVRVGNQSQALARTFIHNREDQRQTFVLSTGVKNALWLDERRFLSVTGGGEVGQSVDLFSLPNNSRSGQVAASARVLSLGPDRSFEGLALSPRGDYAAVGIQDSTPANRYGDDAEEYDASFVRLIRLFGESDEGESDSEDDSASLDKQAVEEQTVIVTHQPCRWERFAWNPDGERYAHATERVYAKPTLGSRERDRDAERDYPVRVYPIPGSRADNTEESLPATVIVSPDPVLSLCWSRDGRTLFALTTPMGDARIMITRDQGLGSRE